VDQHISSQAHKCSPCGTSAWGMRSLDTPAGHCCMHSSREVQGRKDRGMCHIADRKLHENGFGGASAT
jgi:aspartyl aminopeptidase